MNFVLSHTRSKEAVSTATNTALWAEKRLIKVFHQFIGDKYDIAVKWLTKKTKWLFLLKDSSLHPSCKTHKGIYSFGDTYIDETICDVEKSWSEHNSAGNKSESAKHLGDNEEHFSCRAFYMLVQIMAEQVKR